MRFVSFTILLLLAFGVCWGQNVPEASRELGQDYRWAYTNDAVFTPTKIRFPKGSNAINNVPVSPDSLRSCWWVQMRQMDTDLILYWVIWSPCIPVGSDTVYTSSKFPYFTFGGCPVDSLECGGDVSGPFVQVSVGGGY